MGDARYGPRHAATPERLIRLHAMPENSPSERPEFQKIQYQFAAHLRNPEQNPPPHGIENRRLQIYRELFYNNVQNYLSNAFPVLRKLYSEDAWRAMMRDYYARHVSHSPQFYQMAEEFLRYLQEEHQTTDDDPAFLLELAHYEWVELNLGIADADIDWAQIDKDGDLLAAPPVLSPLAVILAYQYPVHTIGPECIPQSPPDQPTYLAVNRDLSDKVHFLKLNAVTARLLGLIEEHPAHTGRQHLEQIAREMSHPNPQVVIDGGAQILTDLKSRDIVLGTRHIDRNID